MLVDFWFDPSCPYTWITSRWMVEVAAVRPVTVRWRIMSLSVLNEGRPDDPEGDPEGYLWGPVRVCAAVERQHGAAALDRFFTAYGGRVHERGEWADIGDVLADAGLPRDLASAAGSMEHDAAVRESHARGIDLVGRHVGTPIISADGPDGRRIAFFGPVISRVPRGERAGRLWDGTLLVAGEPSFHELKGRPAADPTYDH
ncbi:mycothiol-dependent nitroreductase Rv2466c family protein [Polymorphospora rubra]|uniref:mycothiol-dependent nitroreductase Rv2466c family protein n=1 Tax=Polymorphospora rubra TaxID=338584 RepID=UPI00341168FC